MHKILFTLVFVISCLNLLVEVNGNTKYVKILPSDAKILKPKPRIQIPSDFAKKYWVSGTFFNKQNFEGLPMSFYFSSQKCINFPAHKSLSSLKPFGCVMLYNAKECRGPYAVVSHDMANLEEAGMRHSIGSMRSCPPTDDSWRHASSTNNNIATSHSQRIVVSSSEIVTVPPSTTTTSTDSSSPFPASESSIKLVKVQPEYKTIDLRFMKRDGRNE